MINSALSEGIRGIQSSQKEMNRAAQEIARVNIDDESATTNAISQNEETTFAPVTEAQEIASKPKIDESLIELKKQEQLFTANAKVISVANETIGSIINVQS